MASAQQKQSSAAYHSERVIVLGAGMAGLACARELKSRGYRVLVVEARGRPGGRLKGGAVKVSAPVPVPPSSGVSQRASSTAGRRKTKPRPPAEQEQQQLVDLGGALIHGVDDNPVAALAEDMGVETQPVQECLLFQNGWPIDPRYDARISAVFNDCLEETFERCNTRPDNGTSFGELFSEVCVERSVNASSPIFLWHKANLEVSCGASFEELGWQWNEDEPYGYDGDHLAVRNSWKAVVDGLAEDLDVLYDSPVSRVHVVHPEPQPNERVPVSSPSSPRKVASTANKPVTARAKRKFVSAAYSSLASPSLPARKSRRVMHVDADARRSSRANLGQVVERYTDARPPERTGDKKRRPANPSSAKQRHEGNKPPLRPKKQTVVQIVLQNGRVLEADYVVCTLPLAILQSGMVAFDPPLPPAKQHAVQRLGAGLLNKCVLSFPRVFWQESDFMGLAGTDDEDTPYLILNGHAYLSQPILAFLFGGSDARRIESMTDREIVEDSMNVLRNICGRQIPDPIDYRITRWGQEQYSRMAFTYVPPGVDGFRELQAMSEPIYDLAGTKPALMFAGEHSTPYHPSTIHGAFLSGIREAYRLDLTLYPQANEGMSFSDRELYQRTFTVRSRFSSVKNAAMKLHHKAADDPKVRLSGTQDRKQHRRRGAAGVMKLRKRPNHAKDSSSINGALLSSPSSANLRKSPRAAVSAQPTSGSADDHKNFSVACPERVRSTIDPLQQQRCVSELEDSTLLRGMESYGNDHEYFLEILLPVYGGENSRGSSSTMTLAQLKKRCQRLLPVLRDDRAASTATWKRWVAKTVYPPSCGSLIEGVKALKKANRSVTKRNLTFCAGSVSASRFVNKCAPLPAFKSRSARVVRGSSAVSAPTVSNSGPATRNASTSGLGALVGATASFHVNVKTRSGRIVTRPQG